MPGASREYGEHPAFSFLFRRRLRASGSFSNQIVTSGQLETSGHHFHGDKTSGNGTNVRLEAFFVQGAFRFLLK
jgi:hypothetical protein